MQFHLNGFRVGDPNAAEQAASAFEKGELPPKADVLIVGCGPAGLTLGTQLAAFDDISTVIVDQKSGPLQLGQADGVACRTMEMFNAFGFADRVLKEAYWVNETTFWSPDGETGNVIARSGRVQDTEDGLSEFPHVILNQARVHDFYLDRMANSPAQLKPHYGRRLLEVHSTDTDCDFPVTARFERVQEGQPNVIETIRARYVVGCDGARSMVRKSMGRTLKGDSANQAWGVMDVLARTDFPDIRMKSAIHSSNEGNLLIIPREGGYLVRLYIELDELQSGERVASRNITADHLVSVAKKILAPYSLDVAEIAWWSVYEIGQRLCEKFDDVPNGSTRRPRIFIAGDACHTHSPKAGQGMNVSMQDAFNLGWKLATVLKQRTLPHLLDSYSTERHSVAKELIDFDREFAKMFSAKPKRSGEESDDAIDPAEFQRYFVKQGRFTAGTMTRYSPSLIIASSQYQHLASGFEIGTRFHSAPVVRVADVKPVHLGHSITADGRWRLFAFCGPDRNALNDLCEFLEKDPNSPINAYRAADDDIDAVIDVRAIMQEPVRQIELAQMHPFLLPQKGRYALTDYEKIFCADHKYSDDIFDQRGINRQHGALVIVRPDQYVANVLPLSAHGELSAFFDRFMIATALSTKGRSGPNTSMAMAELDE